MELIDSSCPRDVKTHFCSGNKRNETEMQKHSEAKGEYGAWHLFLYIFPYFSNHNWVWPPIKALLL